MHARHHGIVGKRLLVADVRNGLHPAMRAACDDFESHIRDSLARTPKTVTAYLSDVISLMEHAARMGLKQPAELDISVLRSWLAKARSSGIAESSLRRRAVAARTFTRWAAKTKLSAEDAGARLKTGKTPRHLPTILSEEHIRELLNSVGGDSPVEQRDRIILELFYASAVRVAELSGLKLSDVDEERRLLRVVGKRNKERRVPYGLPASHALETYVRQARPSLATASSGDFLLLGIRGKPLSETSLRKIVTQRARSIGLQGISPHSFRHAAATHFLEGGADLPTVKELLGHENIGTTEIYIHVSAERLRAAYEQAHPRA